MTSSLPYLTSNDCIHIELRNKTIITIDAFECVARLFNFKQKRNLQMNKFVGALSVGVCFDFKCKACFPI